MPDAQSRSESWELLDLLVGIERFILPACRA